MCRCRRRDRACRTNARDPSQQHHVRQRRRHAAASSNSSLPRSDAAILVDAFGERTLHLDVRLEHPAQTMRASGQNGLGSRTQRHADAHRFHRDLRDPRQPREWIWWSSVCHRTVPDLKFHPPPPGSGCFVDPANDTCRNAWGELTHCCNQYPGTMPSKCFIGALSWLLSCRQAYVEGIDVLYATNRILITHAGILVNLPRFLMPDRLLMIRDVELAWSLCRSSSGADREWTTGVGDDQFRDVNDRLDILSHLARVLSNLQYIHISLADSSRAWTPMMDLCGWPLYNATETILRSIDTTVFMQLAQLRECRLSLPTSLCWTRKQMEKNEDVIWAAKATSELDVLWRTMNPTAEMRSSIEGYCITHCQHEMGAPIIMEAW